MEPNNKPDLSVKGAFEEADAEGPTTFEADVSLEKDLSELVRDRLARPTTIHFGDRSPGRPGVDKLWQAIRSHTEHISYNAFDEFVEWAFCPPAGNTDRRGGRGIGDEEAEGRKTPKLLKRKIRRALIDSDVGTFGDFFPGADAYTTLKLTAEIFLLLRSGVSPPYDDLNVDLERDDFEWWGGDVFGDAEEGITPDDLVKELTKFLGTDRRSYIRSIIANVFKDRRIARNDVAISPFCPISIGLGPCLLELIWSYWHEQGMQAQTMNAIALRFQNVRVGDGRDPLAELELDPLRPLSGFIWGYIQDEPHRLTVARRAYEYNHHYGLDLYGRAVRGLRPADPRSKFLQSFHDLLRAADQYYRDASDHTVKADAFPLLIALRDLHLVLAEGAGNQFRDLPWTARVEMLTEQWLLARPEMRDFLRGRLMVPYSEPWMGAVDAMKKLQGWNDTNIMHFHDLGVFGERILLSVRHVAWNTINHPDAASQWADFWRPEIQGYVHGYRVATGVSLIDDVAEVSRAGDPRYLQPSFHLRNRLDEQRPREGLPDAGARLQLGAVPRPGARER